MPAQNKAIIAFLIFLSLAMPAFAVVTVTDSQRSEMEKIKRLADDAWAHASRGDNISAGKGIDSVITFAEMLRDSENEAEAREYFRRATIIAPLRVDARFAYARLCAKTGDNDAARSAYKTVLAQAESDEMLAESAAFLGVEAVKKLPAFSSAQKNPDDKKIRLCIVTVPGGQQWLAHDVGMRLKQLFKIDVYVEERDFVPSQPDRGGLGAYAKELREKLPWSDFHFNLLAVMQGVQDKNKATDRQIIALTRKYVQKVEGDQAVEIFDKNIELLAKHGGQWKADMLITRLTLSAMPRIGPRTLYVAMLPQDLYEGTNNFMFGSAQVNGEYGVISYHRFAADNTGETPKRERLVTRTYKQTLSSVGHMLGVPRTADPMCARAYPASLEEHDAKGDKLCDECRAGFAKAFGHELGD